MEVCLCSWNSDREQTTWCNQNLRSWQKWWHPTCLPAQNIPDKSTYLLRWYSKWVVYTLPCPNHKQHEYTTRLFIIQSILSSRKCMTPVSCLKFAYFLYYMWFFFYIVWMRRCIYMQLLMVVVSQWTEFRQPALLGSSLRNKNSVLQFVRFQFQIRQMLKPISMMG